LDCFGRFAAEIGINQCKRALEGPYGLKNRLIGQGESAKGPVRAR